MKYISADIETTGLIPGQHQILEFGAIIEDTSLKLPREKCPQFQRLINRKEYRGTIAALSLNHEVLNEIAKFKKAGAKFSLVDEHRLVIDFKEFLTENNIEKVIFAGKNFAIFDLQFLKLLPDWNTINYYHRILDPTLNYINWSIDEILPNLAQCKERAGLKSNVSHRALDDAWDVIQLLRKNY